MTVDPASYVQAALFSLGVECRTISVKNHEPDVFGNLGAVADTNIGKLRVIYDREFYVEAEGPLPASLSLQQIVSALDRYKLLADNGS